MGQCEKLNERFLSVLQSIQRQVIKGYVMAINRRNSNVQDSLNFKQIAKLILLTNGKSPGYKIEVQPKFKLRETVIQQILGMPLSDSDRKNIVRELNSFGWEVAINANYWLIFAVDDPHMWHDAGTCIPDSLFQELQKNSNPYPLFIGMKLGIAPNDLAKFNKYSQTDIADELAQSVYHKVSEEAIDEYEATGDLSVIGIEDDEQLPFDTFTFWQYVDYYLARNALNRLAPLTL